MENLQKVISNLKTQLAELEKIAAGEVKVENARIWPISIEDLPKSERVWWVCNTEVFAGTAGNDFREYPTEAAALSAIAFSQLSRMVHHINGGDVYPADVSNVKGNWYRVFFDGKLSGEVNAIDAHYPNSLYFKNKEDAIRSTKTHRVLWLQYFTGKKQENEQ
jgi:hypothetical protein